MKKYIVIPSPSGTYSGSELFEQYWVVMQLKERGDDSQYPIFLRAICSCSEEVLAQEICDYYNNVRP